MSQEALARQPDRSSGNAPAYRAWFQCIAGCSGTYELNEIIYQCPKCGNLLEVAHDLDLLRQNSPGQWMALFEKRFRGTDWPYGSSVWGKKEMVCPNVDNRNIVSTYEGGSNLFWAERLGRELGIV